MGALLNLGAKQAMGCLNRRSIADSALLPALLPPLQVAGPCTAYKCRVLTADALEVLVAAGPEGAGGDAEYAWVRSGHALVPDDTGTCFYMFGGEAPAGCMRWGQRWPARCTIAPVTTRLSCGAPPVLF